MTYNYPFFGFPNMRRFSPYYAKTTSFKTAPYNYNSHFNKNSNTNCSANVENNHTKDNKCSKKEPLSKVTQEPFFEILGLKFYYDDILILCLIFFLYKEDVKDQYLFIVLILLLLN